jgi:hypothetical protein
LILQPTGKAKWESERESVHRFEQAGITLRQRSEAAETALEMERKETERRVAEALYKGRMEALDGVFQINGPSRAIARLRKKYNEEFQGK